MKSAHILVVDDDPRLLKLIKRFLDENGFRVTTAANAAEARHFLKMVQPDAMIVDVMMPGEDGISLTRALRDEGCTWPIVALTARGEPEERVGGLEAGADDYMAKPFEPRELVLRLQGHLRRATGQVPHCGTRLIRIGTLEFDAHRGLLNSGDGTIHLTGRDVALLQLFCARPGAILSREVIAGALALEDVSERSVDVQVTRLRKRIEPDPREPRHLQTVRGRGYVFRP